MKSIRKRNSGLADPNITNGVLKKHKKFKRWQSIVSMLAVVVLVISAYGMVLPAMTLEQKTYCSQEEHVHTESCYKQRLICTETEHHKHADGCYKEVSSLTCGIEEGTDGHVHAPECYTVSKDIACGISEGEVIHQHSDGCYEKVLKCGKTEHAHGRTCYSNPEADVETSEVWERSVSTVKLTGVWADDLTAVAESQIGYTESVDNFVINEKDEIKGYSRYGAWYGNEYEDWSGMFVSFCLNYAGIPKENMPYEADCTARIEKLKAMGLYEEAQEAAPSEGDLVFFSPEEGSNLIRRTGIITEVKTDADNNVKELVIIEGDVDNKVKKERYDPANNQIAGYGRLPENPAHVDEETAEDKIETAAMDEAINLADYDIASLTTEELSALLEKITPEQLNAYLDSLSDEEYEALMDGMSEDTQRILEVFLGAEPMLLATGDTYVGFSRQTSSGDIDFAMGGGGAGVKKFYLVPNTVYNQYESYGSTQMYAVQNALLNQSELAYCYNYYKAPPHSRYEVKVQSYGVAKYSEKEKASSSLFYSSTAGRARETDQNTLYRKVLAMAMNGYPNDYSGIGSKYNLSADEFRFITQYAIWYYTDSISLRYKYMNTTQGWMNVFQVYADDTNTCLSLNENGTPGAYSVNNANVQYAYQELIDSSLDPDTVNISHINLYQNINYDYTGVRIYQNLLTVGKEDAPPPQNSLKLKKTVSGNEGDTNKDFTFTITLKDQNKSALSGTYYLSVSAENGVELPSVRSLTFNSQGVATVTLKHGQGIKIEGLPNGFFYKITEAEANQDGYTTTVNGRSDITTTYTGITGNAEVEFVNSKEGPEPKDEPSEVRVKVKAKKTIDNGQTAVGSNKFKFRITGNGVDYTVENDSNGDIYFPEMSYTQPGTYTYTIEELTDDRDGTVFDFDKSKKTVDVIVNRQDVQNFDPDVIYYAYEGEDDYYDTYYYVDTVAGGNRIVMYCTYQGVSGPQSQTGWNATPAKDQTYQAIINPSITEITGNGLIQKNLYGDQLIDRLKKLFYYFETPDAAGIANSDKQALVWTATGKTSAISSISVNGKAATSNASTVLDNIYTTVTPPDEYNLAFFVPIGNQKTDHPQPLATGYGAVVETTAGEAVFNNTSRAYNSLKIGKTVTGTAGDKDKLFNFTISLMNNNFSALNGEFTVSASSIAGVQASDITSITFTNGQASVQLKHGQSISIEGLPDGFYYNVIEAERNADGYTTTLTDAPNNNNSGNGATGNVNVQFENHKDAPPLSYNAEIKAKKWLDDETPAEGQFTFILKKDGVEISRKQNDKDGMVTFPLTFTEPGTYTYTIEELNDGQEGIIYDTEVKTVTVEVSSETLQTIVDSDMFVGSHVSDDYYITVNGDTKLDVYCINGAVGYPGGNYVDVLNPSTSDLEAEVTSNKYGDALEANMRKLLYYFDTHSFTDKVNGTTLSKSYRQELIWCLTGNSYQQHWTYTDALNQILAESEPPEYYTVVMFKSTETVKKQPVVAGYMPASTVLYKGRAEDVEFNNYHNYQLPETGGAGTTGYVMGGLLMMGGAAFLMYILKIKRKKEVKN